MPGVINILLATTGVSTVLNSLGQIQGAIGGLAAIGTAAGASLTGIKGALDLGGELNDLQARTGQSVRDLVVLRRAFDNSGVGAASTAQMIGLLQKGISGLNEEGGKTDEVFKRLGLSQAALREMTATDQMAALTTSFARIANPAERAALAMQLFGRSGGQMLQLLGDSSAISTAEREVGRLAQRAQENAARFDEVGDRLSISRERLREFWLVAAEKAIPALETMASLLQGLNPSVLGASLGNVLAIGGAIGAAGLLKKLDTAILAWGTNPRNPIGGAFAEKILAPLSGGLAKVLPIGLALAIASQVAQGIVAGWYESQNQIRAQANAGFDALGKAQGAVAGIRSQDDVTRARKEIMAQQDQVEKESGPLRSMMWLSAAQQQALDSYNQQLNALSGLLRLLGGDYAKLRIEENLAADAAKERIQLEMEAKQFLQGDDAKKLRDTVAAGTIERRDAEERLLNLQAGLQVTERSLALFASIKAERALTSREEKAQLEIAAQREQILKTIVALESTIAARKAQAAQDANQERLLDIAGRRAALEGDFGTTEAEKYGERKKLLAEEIAAQQAFLAHLGILRDATTDEAARATYDGAITTGREQLAGLQQQEAGQGADPASLVDQARAQLTGLQNQLQSVQQNIAGTFTGAIRAGMNVAHQGMQLLLGDTDYWSGKLGNVAGPIMGAITQGISNMFAQWIAGRIAAAAKSILMSKAEGAADLVAKGPGALLTSISSFGTAAIVGLAAVTAALAAFGGFEAGGYTGGREGQFAGIAHGEEFVFSAPAVRSLGLSNLDSLHQAGRGGQGFDTAAAPLAGAGSFPADAPAATGATNVSVAVFFDESSAMAWLGTRTGKKILYRKLGQDRGELGLQT